ncbi:MAG TPA: YkgJ family cysteine cluster protein [Kofleriaceae bacterium]
MSRYPDLAAKVDAFFSRVQARHGEDMQCGSGCHHCCYVRLSITRVEADAIRAEVAGWTAERKQALTANLVTAPVDHCAALTPSGRCLIYAARPIVCRSHGAPIRMLDARSLLPVVHSCSLNFTERGAAAADADCIVDQTTLSAMVLAIDRDAGNEGERIDLAAVLADC